MSFYTKYLKYKNKYIELKKQLGGIKCTVCNNDVGATQMMSGSQVCIDCQKKELNSLHIKPAIAGVVNEFYQYDDDPYLQYGSDDDGDDYEFGKILTESIYFDSLKNKTILKYNDFNEETKLMDSNKFLNLYRNEIINFSFNGHKYLPIFWQDYYGLFYLSLKFIKEFYKSNSKIISLGESPFKFLFAQSLFYEDAEIKKLMICNNYPNNLLFTELPLSGLSKFTHDKDKKSRVIRDRGVDDILETLNTTINPLIPKFIEYFKSFKLDPKSIIENQDIENFIFIDRAENFNTITSFIYIYAQMMEFLQFSSSDKTIFLSKFKIRTYDVSEVTYTKDELDVTINKINQIINIVFNITKIENQTYNIFYHKSINIFQEEINKRFGDLIKKFEPFKNQLLSRGLEQKICDDVRESFRFFFSVFGKLNIFSSVPEYLDLKSRCIKSYNIVTDTYSSNIKHDKGGESENCNLFNLITYIIFNKIKNNQKNSLRDLIINLDKINEYELTSLDKSSLFPLDKTLNILWSSIIGIIHTSFDYTNIIKQIHKLLYLNQDIFKNTIFDENTYSIPYYSKENRILYLDFDVTLGSFHMNLSFYYNVLTLLPTLSQDTLLPTLSQDIIEKILSKLLTKYYLRHNINLFFQGLQELKLEKKIEKIIIYTRNIDRGPKIPLFVKLIQNITNTPNLIDDIIWTSGNKDLQKINASDIIYIVDDKCEHIIQKEQCIQISPFLAYVDLSLFEEILKEILTENGISEDIIKSIIDTITPLQVNDFNIKIKHSFINQYLHIDNFVHKYQPTELIKFKKNNDEELLRVLNIIKEKYL